MFWEYCEDAGKSKIVPKVFKILIASCETPRLCLNFFGRTRLRPSVYNSGPRSYRMSLLLNKDSSRALSYEAVALLNKIIVDRESFLLNEYQLDYLYKIKRAHGSVGTASPPSPCREERHPFQSRPLQDTFISIAVA